MIKQSVLNEVVEQQRDRLQKTNLGYLRILLSQVPNNLENHALIISGIRRCGKSTLLHQILNSQPLNTFF